MERLQKLVFPVKFEQVPTQEITLAGYLFFCNGLFLQQQLVRENMLEFDLGNVEAGIQPSDVSELRLFIVPVTNKKMQSISSIEQLEKLKPYEPVLTRGAEGRFDILPIPVDLSAFWHLCICRIKGKVSKWFHIGNTWKERAVCRAKVHICEIDAIRYWIYQIPDNIIAKIPEAILNPREVIKFPIPIPDPPPFVRSELTKAALQPHINIFKTTSAEQQVMEAAAKLPELSLDIRQSLASGNLNLVREVIVNNYALFHPWFCYWPWWWPYFYRCDELAVVYTDANGRFDTNIFYRCGGDKPDIYIWVEYFINGAWTTVYNPPIPCYTFWDYACGTNINIHITDPRVPGDCCCSCPLPGELVWIRSIGSANVIHINQDPLSLAPAGQLQTFDRIGLSSFLTSPADYRRPFGSNISFYMGFGGDLPNSGMHYYRWRYQQVNLADLSAVTGSVEYLDNLEIKEYSYEVDLGGGNIQAIHDSVTLGPQPPVGGTPNLYIIPPPLPSGAPFNKVGTNLQWYQPTHNTRVIAFNSALLKNGSVNGGDGLYEFTLELFDQAGNLLSNIPKNTFKVSDDPDENNTVNAPDKFLVSPTASTADAFKMLVRIDNAKCHSQILPVNVDTHPATVDCCGFVSYKHEDGTEADLDLSFVATHPNNLAEFSFGVVKGTCGSVSGTEADGIVIDSADGYTLTTGTYKKHFTPAELLGTCYSGGTGKAAFAETLYVSTLATDGYQRVYANDATPNPFIAAFALEP